MPIKSIKQAKNLKNKRVLVRVDFNVPISRRRILDDARLVASLPTIQYLIEKKAKVILVAHLGRPDGKVVRSLKLDPVAKRLGRLLNKKIKVVGWKRTTRESSVLQKVIDNLLGGQVIVLENIRFLPDEKKNPDKLGKELASLADIFVQECFAVAHRSHGSIIGVPKYLPSYAGFLLEDEIKGLKKVTTKPKKPFIVVVGGAKVETKIPVMKNLLPKASNILIGGAVFNTCLKAEGYKVGDSLVNDDFKKEAIVYCKNKKVVKPIDVIVGKKDGSNYHIVEVGAKSHQICKKGEAIYDIGPKTIQLFSTYTKKAQTLVWNGAVGYFEQKPYDVGTLSIARLVASRAKGKAYGIIGGGETLAAMDLVGMAEYVDLISTGGGAMLAFLAGEKLPGIEVLNK